MITGTLGESSFFVALIGVLIVCLVSIAELNSLFRSQLIVSHYNNQLMRKTLQKLTDQVLSITITKRGFLYPLEKGLPYTNWV